MLQPLSQLERRPKQKVPHWIQTQQEDSKVMTHKWDELKLSACDHDMIMKIATTEVTSNTTGWNQTVMTFVVSELYYCIITSYNFNLRT